MKETSQADVLSSPCENFTIVSRRNVVAPFSREASLLSHHEELLDVVTSLGVMGMGWTYALESTQKVWDGFLEQRCRWQQRRQRLQ